jgi:polyphosphate kinase
MASRLDVDTTAEAEAEGDVVAEARHRHLNRELSWLEFNRRVLALAEDPTVPLLERAKFLAIFSQNLDEFFMVRVAGLADQEAAGLAASSSDELAPAEQLKLIADRARALVERQVRVFVDDVAPALAGVGIRLSDWRSLDDDDRDFLVDVFQERIFPVLTPLALDPGHPFPYISNLSLNLAVIVHDRATDQRRFARVKVPPLLPRFVVMPDGERFVPLEQVIAAHLELVFPGMEIERHHAFRVTRNADLTLVDEEADDLLAAVELELRRRRFGRGIRLEVDEAMPEELRTLLLRELELEEPALYAVEGPLDLTGLWAVHALDRPDLKDDPFAPAVPAALAPVDDDEPDVFAVLRQGDVLVHHPYESFTGTVEAFVRQAAADPAVLAIKLTLYRTSGQSPIVKALIRAAERGKQVAVLIELKARFDEEANIAWARALEEAGVHVVYGLLGLKTHAKCTLVVRDEPGGIRRYCHIGTGNYNPSTAAVYEDIGLLTADDEVGADLTDLFNFLTGYSRQTRFRRILVAPLGLRERLVELVAEEARPGGRIAMKVNSLVDERIIDGLNEASQAGARIDLVIRGICRLRPGVPGLSEHIRVRSILGRYLEHSRVFAFGGGDDGPVRWFIGSADLMARNLDRRVEVLVPVVDVALQRRLQEIMDVDLADDCEAWALDGDGNWTRRPGVSSQRRLQELAVDRARWDPAQVPVPRRG